MEDQLTNGLMQTGAFGLCVFLLTLMGWIIKKLLNVMTTDLKNLQRAVDSLPCRNSKCPVGHDQ